MFLKRIGCETTLIYFIILADMTQIFFLIRLTQSGWQKYGKEEINIFILRHDSNAERYATEGTERLNINITTFFWRS